MKMKTVVLLLLVSDLLAGASACAVDWKPLHVSGCFNPSGGHIQGMCTDGEFLYLSQKTGIHKIDPNGVCAKKVATVSHTGDFCYHDGKIYSSIAIEGGPDKGKGRIQVFDRELNLVKEKAYPRGTDGIAWLNGSLYVGGGSHLETVPSVDGKPPASKTPHDQNDFLRVDPETLEVKEMFVSEHGYKTRYGAQNIKTDGTYLYVCFYKGENKAPDLVVFDTAFKPVRRATAAAGNGFEFVGMKDGRPVFLKCRTENGKKAKDVAESKLLTANVSFATVTDFIP